MKKLPALLLAGSLAAALVSFAEDVAAKKEKTPSGEPVTIPATAARLTAPLELKAGAISQAQTTELGEGGKAVFEFTVPKDGEYVVHAVVNAGAEDANSFYLNLDAPPEDPAMIWDIDVTNGFEDRVVSWRGNGDADNDQFKPKHFTLKAGAHQLILVGREGGAQLKSISVRPAA